MPGRLVGVSWCMPPALFPRSVQVARLMKGLARLGWQSTIVAPTLETLSPDDTIDRGLAEAYGTYYTVLPVDGRERSPAGWRQRWQHRFSGERHLRGDALWTERAARAATAAARECRADALVTFAQPWKDHLAGLAVRRSLPRLPWVAHFSDPWTDSIYSTLAGEALDAEQQREAAVIEAADRIVFTNVHAADLVMKKYPPTWQAKARVVPHAMDDDLQPQAPAPLAPRARLRLAHVGNLLAGRRTANALFDTLIDLRAQRPLDRELEVVFLGEGSGLLEAETRAFVERLEPIVTFRPRVPYRDSLAMMIESDALLLIDAPAKTNAFLPSKLVDYLMTGRPILALTPASGATADVLRRCRTPLVAPDDVGAVTRALAAMLDRHRLGLALDAPDVAAVRHEFGLEATAAAFAAVLDEARSGR